MSTLTSENEHERASPIFHFCRPPKQDNLLSLRHSLDCSYLLKIPNSRSSNASLSSVLEDSAFPQRAQPPNSLSLHGNREQQMLNVYRKMASVESIGACSLDFEASAAEFSAKDLTASEATLHSGVAALSVHEAIRNGDLDDAEKRECSDKLKSVNGFKTCNERRECAIAEIKLPSYVSISCAINGYPNYSRFCRSRDNSPARSSFRKSSLEPSMLADTSRKEAYESHRYSRSQSDCNGTMQTVTKLNSTTAAKLNGSVQASHTVFTESKHVTVSKQIQVPLKSSRKFTTEVTFSNGHTERTVSSVEVTTNGGDGLVLAKEVGKDGTKSLVQQRIESLYGKNVGDDVQVSVKGKKEAPLNGAGEDAVVSRSPTPNGKNHIGSVSPPVFRHLNKDFRKQLQINIPKKIDCDKPNLQKDVGKELLAKKNGFSNGVGHDECDRMKSLTPPPLKSKSITDVKPACSPDGDGEGYRFLNLIDVEKEKIQAQAKALEEELAVSASSIPEEASGKIRAACGKANLLITQKFEQFRGLCWKHIEENPSVPFYTTASDLAGFWDLVMLQVDDINSTFNDIEAMKNNGWKEVVCEKPAPLAKIRQSNLNAVSRSNPTTPKRSAKSAELTKAREEARRQLLAAKKKGRQQTASNDGGDIAIFTPSS